MTRSISIEALASEEGRSDLAAYPRSEIDREVAWWSLYDDAAATLRTLQQAGLKLGVCSNLGTDHGPVVHRLLPGPDTYCRIDRGDHPHGVLRRVHSGPLKGEQPLSSVCAHPRPIGDEGRPVGTWTPAGRVRLSHRKVPGRIQPTRLRQIGSTGELRVRSRSHSRSVVTEQPSANSRPRAFVSKRLSAGSSLRLN